MNISVACIVEGHGEVQAVPVLLRRIQQLLHPEITLTIPRPVRAYRTKLVKPTELERTIELAVKQVQRPRTLLILVDAEDDCPRDLAPKIRERAIAARSDLPIGVVLATHEFEAWFLAAFESLAGCAGLSPELPTIPAPESISNAKGVLTRHMQARQAYSPTIDQAKLTAVFDMELARSRSSSFDKCWREVERLLAETMARDEGV